MHVARPGRLALEGALSLRPHPDHPLRAAAPALWRLLQGGGHALAAAPMEGLLAT